MLFRNHRSQWFAAVIIYMVFILFASLKPAVVDMPSSWLREMLHNLCHVPAYSGLAFLVIGLFMAYGMNTALFRKAFYFCVLYGLLMEFLQGFVPGRTPSVMDLSLNASGVLITIFLVKKGFFKRFLTEKI